MDLAMEPEDRSAGTEKELNKNISIYLNEEVVRWAGLTI